MSTYAAVSHAITVFILPVCVVTADVVYTCISLNGAGHLSTCLFALVYSPGEMCVCVSFAHVLIGLFAIYCYDLRLHNIF